MMTKNIRMDAQIKNLQLKTNCPYNYIAKYNSKLSYITTLLNYYCMLAFTVFRKQKMYFKS